MKSKFLLAGMMAFSALASASAAMAQQYPTHQIVLVVPFPAGSATDNVSRRLAESLRAAMNVAEIGRAHV